VATEYVATLSKRLTLNEQQVGSLNAILDDTRSQFKQLKERHKSEADQLKMAQTNKVRAMLNPSQLSEYEKLPGRTRPEGESGTRGQRTGHQSG
jgi:hypothetical protein